MRLCKRFSLLLTDLAAKTISVLVLVSADRTRFERMRSSEQYTDVRMRSRLVFTREVKVDIRLLVALKSEERLERNVLSVRDKFLAALGQFFGGRS